MTDATSSKTDDILAEARERFAHINETDADNRRLQREDTRFVYADDSQITSIDMRKVWGAVDQVEVTFSW